MLNDQDRKCPVCEKTFEEMDDVVVCPHCGAPHHRFCYEQKGACHFADRHAESADWHSFVNVTSPNRGTAKCPICGFENDSTIFFCLRCGESLIETPPPNGRVHNLEQHFSDEKISFNTVMDPYAGMHPEDRIGKHSVEELAAFVGPNSFYYLPRFRDLEEEGRNVFNYAGALLNTIWFFFRGMNVYGFILMAVMVLCNFLNAYMTTLITKSSNTYDHILLSVALFLILGGAVFLCGFLANRIYKNYCDEQISRIKQTNPKDLLEALKTQGGIRPRNAYTAFAVFVVVNFVGTLIIGLL